MHQATVSELVLSDRLIALAEDADRAGYTDMAEHLLTSMKLPRSPTEAALCSTEDFAANLTLGGFQTGSSFPIPRL